MKKVEIPLFMKLNRAARHRLFRLKPDISLSNTKRFQAYCAEHMSKKVDEFMVDLRKSA